MPLSTGEKLGPYEILGSIGAGGMGKVYRAHDSRLNRDVAIKVSNAQFTERFTREARAIAALNHANICHLYDVGPDYLVMEYVEGHDLRGPLDFDDALPIIQQLIDGIEAAHEKNIIHRDLKPANIRITPEGVVKILDFGLAKAMAAAPSKDGDPDNSPTLTIGTTQAGTILGTAAYMAPEQAKGKPADRRSDVFALGVTLWETALDRRLFHDDSDVETVRRVRAAEVPDPKTLVDGFPPALATAISRALARDPDDRWQTAAELRDALDAYVGTTGEAVDASSVRALWTELFAGAEPAPWERLADEVTADQARTRIWDERKEAVGAEAAPARVPPTARPPALPARLAAIAGAGAVLGALVVGLAVRGCRGGSDTGAIEQRIDRIEELLGIGDAGPSAAGNAPVSADTPAPVSLDDRSASCALAKVAAYRVWQEAVGKAKANAAPAEAACADLWSDTKKQACYRAAMAQIRATQGARDAVIAGGAAAVETVKGVREDAKNEAIARARVASQAAFTACADEGD